MKLRRDSLLHAETCALIAVAASLVLPWWAAGVLALGAGVGKELWDSKHDGCASWADFMADLVGVACGIFLVFLLN